MSTVQSVSKYVGRDRCLNVCACLVVAHSIFSHRVVYWCDNSTFPCRTFHRESHIYLARAQFQNNTDKMGRCTLYKLNQIINQISLLAHVERVNCRCRKVDEQQQQQKKKKNKQIQFYCLTPHEPDN